MIKTRGRLLCLLLALVLLTGIAPGASAEELSGQCGDSAYWSYNSSTETLTISGYGRMYDEAFFYLFDCNHIDGFDTSYNIREIIIKPGITHVGDYAFYTYFYGISSFSKLEGITIPDTVTSIGRCAFYGRGVEVYIPASVKEIGAQAFEGCNVTLDPANKYFKKYEGYLCSAGGDEIISNINYDGPKTGLLPDTLKTIDFYENENVIYFSEDGKLHIPPSVKKVYNIAYAAMSMKDRELYFYSTPEEFPIASVHIDGGFYYGGTLNIYYPAGNAAWNAIIKDYEKEFGEDDARLSLKLMTFTPWTPGEYPTPDTDPVKPETPDEKPAPDTGIKLCETHTYTSAGGDYCTVCGFKFEPVVTDIEDTYFYAVKNNVPIRDSYYATASKVVRRENKDTPLLAVASLVNSVGNLWYKLNDGTYVYSENVTTTEPPRNIVYFDANGGTGVPSKCSSIGRVLISSTTIPTRPGYTFLGYSKDKNAVTAQYFPGQYINEKQTITLYAVWEKDNDYAAYRKKVDALKAAIGSTDLCQRQINALHKEGNQYCRTVGGGECNVSSATTLLNRNLYYEGKQNEAMFTPRDVYAANGCEVDGPFTEFKDNYSKENRQIGYYITTKGGTSNYWRSSSKLYKNASGSTYRFGSENRDVIEANRKKEGLTLEEYLQYILRQHPEGICIRNNSSTNPQDHHEHIIVITDYEISEKDGTVTYNVQDPMRQYTGPLEGSWLYGKCKNMTTFFKELQFIAYIK